MSRDFIVLDFQNIAASFIVLAAALWLIRRIVRVYRAASSKVPTAGCGSCPQNRSSQIMQISELDAQPAPSTKTPSQTPTPESD